MREYVFPVLTIVFVTAQHAILDYYLFVHQAFGTWEDLVPWIIADVVIVCVLSCIFYYNWKYTRHEIQLRSNRNSSDLLSSYGQASNGGKNHHVGSMGSFQRQESRLDREFATLPAMYIGWLAYSALLVAKIIAIFKTFGSSLDGKTLWGTNELEFIVTGTAGIFAFLIASRKRTSTPSQKVCLKFLQSHVLLEIIDCVEFLTILFTAEHHLHLPGFLTDMILGFACANMILPTVGLFQLSTANLHRVKPREHIYILQTILSTVFGNLPYLVIRVYLWKDHNFTNALFVMKNIISIGQNVVELTFHFQKSREHHRPTSASHNSHLAALEDDFRPRKFSC
ncbi:hypothetical protein RvY_07144 [Ramazzottius varieornatus]|uniref:Uncharacterized protein n=1 Tax=Ramazzottius varieornatus TaxID=947166 RepID=A0A1D1V9M7_RAMVA|nr:hypothetical protein RvY_07144 [Ramazzottius varieornatus]